MKLKKITSALLSAAMVATLSIAAFPTAPDADQNGIINEDDADMVLTSYALMMSNNSPLGNVGEIDVFELFD